MPTPIFPEAVALQFTAWNSGRLDSTDIETARSGREVRRGVFPTGGYFHATATTAPLTQADAQTLRDFARTMRGRLTEFYLYPPDAEYYSDEDAGSVASASTFIIPFKDTDLTLVKVGGVSKAFTITAGAGDNGEDQINFTGGAQTGDVTITGFARPQYLVRFDADDIGKDFLVTADFRTIWALKFKQVR